MINSSVSPLLWIDSEQLSNSSLLHFHYPELFTKQLLGIILGSRFSAGDIGADVSGISASGSFGSEATGRPQAFHHEDLVSRFWAVLISCGRAERLDGPVLSSIRRAEFCKSGFPPWILMFTKEQGLKLLRCDDTSRWCFQQHFCQHVSSPAPQDKREQSGISTFPFQLLQMSPALPRNTLHSARRASTAHCLWYSREMKEGNLKVCFLISWEILKVAFARFCTSFIHLQTDPNPTWPTECLQRTAALTQKVLDIYLPAVSNKLNPVDLKYQIPRELSGWWLPVSDSNCLGCTFCIYLL